MPPVWGRQVPTTGGVGDGLGDGVAVLVGVGVGVEVLVGVGDGEEVLVGVGDGDEVTVGVGEGLEVTVGVGVGVDVAVAVGVGVDVTCGVDVGTGEGTVSEEIEIGFDDFLISKVCSQPVKASAPTTINESALFLECISPPT